MRQRLIATDLAIEELLGGTYSFSIPAYQRDYTWTREEAVQLVDDVAAVIEDVERDGAQTPYFLGTMLLIEPVGGTAEGKGPRPVEVVDGQQRLITLAILFSVLRDMAEAREGGEIDRLVVAQQSEAERRPHLALRAADETFFATAIQKTGATRRGQTPEALGDSVARRNIEDVRRALRSKMQREFSVAERHEFFAFMARHARVLVVVSDDFDYAYQIFLTINDRGKRLSVEDIFRGEILGPLDREQRLRYEAIIDEMEKYREEAESTRTKGKTFFSHLATIDGWPRRGIIEGLKQAVEKRGGPRRFVTEMFAPMAESYLQIRGGGSATSAATANGAVQDWLAKLRWLEMHGDDDWVPVAMVGIDRLNEDPSELAEFLQQLDRYAHGLMALGCGREARRKHYTPILQQILAKPEMPAFDGLFAITRRNQKAIIRNIATRLHIVDPPTARLVLLRADQVISQQPTALYRPFIARDRRDPECFTVEHICPKGRLEQGDWLRLFPRQSVRERAAECVGNLALVTDTQNKKSGQLDFAEKIALFFPEGELSPFHLTNLVGEEKDWDGLAIARRYNLIMGAVREMWSLAGPIPVCPALGKSPVPRPGPEAETA